MPRATKQRSKKKAVVAENIKEEPEPEDKTETKSSGIKNVLFSVEI